MYLPGHAESTPYLLVSTWYNGIFRMNLDGSDVVQVVNGNDAGQYVRGLAVDYKYVGIGTSLLCNYN